MDYSITLHNNGETRIFSFNEVVRDDKFNKIDEKFESVLEEEGCVVLTTENAKNEEVGVLELSEGEIGEIRYFSPNDLKGIIKILEK